MKTIAKFFVCLLVVATPLSVSATTWYIQSDGFGDAPTIQAGIDSSAAGDTVLVASGTYTGMGNYDIDFNGKAIVVTSESGAENTIIDCLNNARGFIFQNAEGLTSVLTGFTIVNGYSTGMGGGIYCENASPDVSFNIVQSCHAVGHGGGIGLRKSDAYIHNNTVSECSTDSQGGALAVREICSPTISRNILSFSTLGEGVACITGGANPTLSCNDVFGNAGGDVLCGVDSGDNGATDPQFCGVLGTGNYFLQSDSPCLPFSSPCSQLVGAIGVGCATVDTENSTWGLIKALFE